MFICLKECKFIITLLLGSNEILLYLQCSGHVMDSQSTESVSTFAEQAVRDISTFLDLTGVSNKELRVQSVKV